MVSTARISIVMPLFNKAEQVLATVASVQAQSVQDWELVVVDDGSTDAGPDLLRGLADARIRVFSQTNAGVSAARNRGIELAGAELIAFLDADDLWHPAFLATILELHHNFPEAQWFATGYEIRPPKGDSFASRLRGVGPSFRRGVLHDYFGVAVCSDPPVWTSATAVFRSALQTIGGFPVGIGSGEDLLTWARLAMRYPLAYEARPLAVFQVSGIERRPDPQNRVGLGLEDLVRAHPDSMGLRAYLGLWYRMQAVMAMRFGDGRAARRLSWRSVNFHPAQWRNAYTCTLACLPGGLRLWVDKTLRRIGSRVPGQSTS